MRTILIVFLTMSLTCAEAQDPSIANPNGILLSINPSFAGSNCGIRDQFFVRDELNENAWSTRTYMNSLDYYAKKIKAGLGFSAYYQNISDAVVENSGFKLTYSQNIKIKKTGISIIPSVQWTYFSNTFSEQRYNIVFGYFNNPGPYNVYKKSGNDLGSGFLLNYKNNTYAGLYFFHLNKTDISFYYPETQPILLSAHASHNLYFGKKNLLHLLAIYTIQKFPSYGFADKRKEELFRLNTTLVLNRFIIGGGITTAEAFSYFLGYRGNFFKITLGVEQYRGFELQLSINLPEKENRKKLTSIESW